MARLGYLKGSEMAGTFDLLRANDLIFNYVVSNWLMGKQPPAFDILDRGTAPGLVVGRLGLVGKPARRR
jgi:poly(3-hydroxyalkanoate) synthetase